jgi:hypothetical protein
MKKIIKLTESDLMRIVKRVIKEEEDRMSIPGKYFTLGGFHFYVSDGRMYLADKSKGDLSPNLMIEFPSTKEISAVWTRNTKEIDIPEIKGKELKGLEFDKEMQNGINYGKEVYNKNKAIVNFGSMIPIIFYSQKFGAPTLGGFIIGTDFHDGVEGRLTTIEDPKPGDRIYFQQSTFKMGKEYGISLEVSMHGQPINMEDFGMSQNMLKLPKIYNIGDFFDENAGNPRSFEKASFLEGIRNHIKGGGKINKITIDASTSKMPAGRVDNDDKKSNWKELNEYDDVVMGNNDDGTGNLQLCKHKAINTYNSLKRAIPELASAPYVLKASGPIGEFVHIKFE